MYSWREPLRFVVEFEICPSVRWNYLLVSVIASRALLSNDVKTIITYFYFTNLNYLQPAEIPSKSEGTTTHWVPPAGPATINSVADCDTYCRSLTFVLCAAFSFHRTRRECWIHADTRNLLDNNQVPNNQMDLYIRVQDGSCGGE